MDGSSTLGWLLLGLQKELQEKGRLAAEPWNQAGRQEKPKRRGGVSRLASSRPVCEPCPAPDACCLET